LEEGADSEDVLQHLMVMLRDPKPILWVETCFGFEQYIAIHFNSHDFSMFDELLTLSKQLLLKSTPDYFNIVKTMSTSTETKMEDLLSASYTLLTNFTQEFTSHLTIIDSPICRRHQYFTDCVTIHQDNRYDDYDYHETYHGTFVAGVVRQINSNVVIHSFPAGFINVFIERGNTDQYEDIQLFQQNRRMMLSGIGKISAALTSFLNSETSKLRSKGFILVVAAGNRDESEVGIGIDRSVDNLFAPFVDVESGENNIVFVAAVDQVGQFASFSNYGRTKMMLAAPGVDIYSCSFPSDEFKVNSGTSFAVPQVSVNRLPLESHTEIFYRLLASVEDTLTRTTISGGRLNIGRALGIDLESEQIELQKKQVCC
jgi:subtilisin family serine protease